jgi:hypothetical protein
MLAGKVDGRGTMRGGIPKFFSAGKAMTMIEREKALLHRSAATIGACRLARAACGDALALKSAGRTASLVSTSSSARSASRRCSPGGL